MNSLEAQKVISRYRDNAAVIATYTTNREWPQVSDNPSLDLLFAGGMGKASSLGLGLAIACRYLKVIVLDGDGSLLMNLGSMVTISHMAPPNLIHFLFENGVYRTTGGQPIPNVATISFSGMARASGYANVYEFEEVESLAERIPVILKQAGPTFVCLKIEPSAKKSPLPYTTTSLSRIAQFKKAVADSNADI